MYTRIRFTDEWPPPELLVEYPNWVFAWEEGRPGQDESTIKPARQQRFLSEDVVYTAGDAWLPDDESYPALIELSDYRPVGLVVYEGDHIWEIDYDYDINAWRPSAVNDPPVTLDDSKRFPLRFMSTLPESRRVGQIRRVISAQGFASEWVYDE